MPVDLSDMSQVDKFAEEVLKKYGCVDVLVNNAAILGPIDYEGDAVKNPNMGQGPIDGKNCHFVSLGVQAWSACSATAKSEDQSLLKRVAHALSAF